MRCHYCGRLLWPYPKNGPRYEHLCTPDTCMMWELAETLYGTPAPAIAAPVPDGDRRNATRRSRSRARSAERSEGDP